jgi:putative acetyltransferase
MAFSGMIEGERVTRRTEITIRPFGLGDEAVFRQLNEEWIRRYFVLEPKDEASFTNPQKTILDNGGRIFFAVQKDEVVGCCALIAIGPGEFEVAKMAVTESCQGAGIGRRLLEQTIAAARALGAKRLYLETNQKLAAAIRLYESVGFRHLPCERIVPSPYARANVYMELYLEAEPQSKNHSTIT